MTSIIIGFLKFIQENFVLLTSILLIFYVVISTSLYFIYQKVDVDSKKALIPILNIVYLLKIVSLPRWMILLIFVPYINFIGIFIMIIIIGWRLGHVFSLNIKTKLGLMFLPIIFFPLLSKKDLTYQPYQPSEKLVKQQVVPVKKDFVLEVPKYDVSAISGARAISVNDYIEQQTDSSMAPSKQFTTFQNENNEVADLTFDYNKLYDNNMESDLKMNQNQYSSVEPSMNGQVLNQEPIVGVAQPQPVPEIQPVPSAAEVPVSAPIPEIVPTPVAEPQVVVQPQPVIGPQPVPSAAEVPVSAPIPEVVPTPVAEPQVVVQPQPVIEIQPVPSAAEVPVSAPIPEIVPTPVAEPQVVVQPQPVIEQQPVPSAVEEPKNTGEDNFTLDYNQLYNIPTPPPTAASEQTTSQPVNNDESVKANDNNASAGVSVLDSKESFNTLQMAAPPSFEVETKPKEETVVEQVIPETRKEDLVSIDIVEPNALPVGNLVKNSMNEKPVDYNDIMSSVSTPIAPSVTPEVSQPAPSPVTPTQPQPQPQTSTTQPIPDAATQMNPFSSAQNTSLLRENEDNRSEESAKRGPAGSKFIDNEENKYTLPHEEPIPVQMPTDPNLISNPMAIFGVSAGVLRPTAEEAIREPDVTEVANPSANTNTTSICPNCGFVVKEGQPSCVVCGYKFE